MNKTRRRKVRVRKAAATIATLESWRLSMMAATAPDMERHGMAMFEIDADGMHSVPLDDDITF